jgi:D-glycero-beta-D-manno-heptose 1-phosphate adenylyltransferase
LLLLAVRFCYFYRNTFNQMTLSEIIRTKIFTEVQLFIPILNRWKKADETVVFTNGCFDLVHRGHIDSLAKAADLGDRLIVGLNSDVSVKLLKGENRPLIDQQSRAILLASLLMVDAVVIFNEETPYELIKNIVPDILVKGTEYKIEEIAGFDIVLAAGGKVERIELTEGFSTSDLIKKIKDKF